MDVRNCSRCGKIYAYDGFKVCPSCRREDEKDFKSVKEYIAENPGANVSEVSDETGVEVKKIIEFLRQGRLEVKDENNLLLSCEKCGKPIKTGRFCDQCTAQMQKEFNRSIGGGKSSKDIKNGRAKERMRITDRYKR